jgi:hypothetical protein
VQSWIPPPFDLDRVNNICVHGTKIVGVSESFKSAAALQTGLRYHDDNVVGIEFHGFSLFNEGGAQLSSATFSGFQDSTGSNSFALIGMDEVWSGSFDYTSSVTNIAIKGDVASSLFNFTKALESGIKDIYIINLDSSMKPQGNATTGVSLISYY